MTDTQQITVEEYRDGVKIKTGTITVQIDPRTVDLRAVKSDYRTARANLVAANQTLQAASTTAQLSAAVKAFASANLLALRVLERAIRHIDDELDGIEM